MDFYGRAKQITELASFYLNTEEEQALFKTSNLRNNFLSATCEKFTQLIESREAQACMKYTPNELVATFNIQAEKEKKKSAEDMTIRYMNTQNRFTVFDNKKSKNVSPLLSLKNDDEMTELKDSRGRNMRKKSKFRRPRSLSFSRDHLNKKNYSRQNAKNGVDKKLLNMTDQRPNDCKVNFKKYPTKFDLDTTVKPKRTPNEE
jgi:hypothetical protein